MIGEKRRVVVVLVEGRSEIACLKPILSYLYDDTNPNYEVFFPPMVEEGRKRWGDFTSKNGINRETAAGCINKLYLNPFLEQNGHLPPDCIGEIIHIVDMDGAYIDDASVKHSDKHEKTYYGKNEILTSKVDDIIGRNRVKRNNIDCLYALDFIKNGGCCIPYSVYFFSSNLDHVISNDANVPFGYEKVEKAEEFASQFEDNPEDFLKAIESMPGTLVGMSYGESWDFIRERGSNSIEPHTNINILLRKIMGM